EELSPDLDEALNQLKDDDRQALLLRFFGSKTMRDVGAALGVSEDAAKMRVSRAVDRLRTQLGVRGAACTAAVLGTILAERSVEAVPAQLVSQLAAVKLPQPAVVAGTTGPLGMLRQTSKFNLAASALVLVLIGAGVIHLARSSTAPAPQVAVAGPNPGADSNAIGIARRKQFDPGGFNPAEAAPSKPVKILFHVLDAESGVGLANVKIQAAYFGAGGIDEGHDVLTDHDGVAAIPQPDDPTKNRGPNVFVTAEGHVPKVVAFREPTVPTDYTMKLDPAKTAAGLVVDEQGLPVAGVEILIQGPGSKPGQSENVDFQTCPVTNRDDGSWSCSYIPKDYTNEIRFILKKQGYSVTFPMVPVAKVDLSKLVLVIERGFTVTGKIADSQSRPIVNARIQTSDGNPIKRQSTKTDEQGIFTLVGVPGHIGANGLYQDPPLETNASGGVIIRGMTPDGRLHVDLAVQAEGFAPQASTLDLADPTNVANFILLSGNIFRGRVVDEAGDPVPNAVARTDWDFKNQLERRFDWTSHTDGNGQFEWASAPAGEICYWFEADGYSAIRCERLAADGSDHEITLKRLPSGQVR
ncbi:MAG: hypothetical protein JWR69_3306, partial [Pedosphaera sp.]|nr:hypothetical protein [Pedosphaera sp.]